MARHTCKVCGITGEENFYKSHAYYCKTHWNQEVHRRQKQKFIDYLNQYRSGVKCEKCGYDKGFWGLAFHHRDPSVKEFSIEKNRGKRLEALKQELDKCDVLCHNCHAEVHAHMRGDI